MQMNENSLSIFTFLDPPPSNPQTLKSHKLAVEWSVHMLMLDVCVGSGPALSSH